MYLFLVHITSIASWMGTKTLVLTIVTCMKHLAGHIIPANNMSGVCLRKSSSLCLLISHNQDRTRLVRVRRAGISQLFFFASRLVCRLDVRTIVRNRRILHREILHRILPCQDLVTHHDVHMYVCTCVLNL